MYPTINKVLKKGYQTRTFSNPAASALPNGSFRAAIWAVLACDMGRFALPNGLSCSAKAVGWQKLRAAAAQAPGFPGIKKGTPLSPNLC